MTQGEFLSFQDSSVFIYLELGTEKFVDILRSKVNFLHGSEISNISGLEVDDGKNAATSTMATGRMAASTMARTTRQV
jgi:hypothetical protein